MPQADALTAIREPHDLEADKIDEVTWVMIQDWIPTPQLFFTMRELVREHIRKSETNGDQL